MVELGVNGFLFFLLTVKMELSFTKNCINVNFLISLTS